MATRRNGKPTDAPAAYERGLAPRRAALVALKAVREGDAFDVALARAVADLADADRRLAHEIAAGVLRNREELDRALMRRVTGDWRRVQDDVRDVLRIGAHQLLSLTRVPPHAAVAATVELAKRERGVRAAGFVNAVLRRLAAEVGDTLPHGPDLGEPAEGADPGSLAQRFSHPAWLVARWAARFGPERTVALLEHNNRRPSVSLQPARWSEAELRAALVSAGVEPLPAEHDVPGLAVRGVRVRELPGYAEGAFVVQDPAQVLALSHMAVPDGALVWDACAAPGGKTVALAARCRVVASDGRRDRAERLADTLRRAAPGVRFLVADARAAPFAGGRFDVVVLDAPCSATGTFAKHPDARWRATPARLERLRALQAVLLDGVAPAVRPGGALAYMTCSLEREENETQVDRFLERHPEFARDREDVLIFPTDRGTDGAFAARLARAT